MFVRLVALALDRNRCRMRLPFAPVQAMKRLLASLALVAALTGPTGALTPSQCAKALGITYSAQDGATERLDAFQACTKG